MSKPISPSESVRRKRVLCFGTFDILHYGHVKYLNEAKKLGGENSELIVVISRDSSVESMKGKKPIFSEEHRRALVASIKSVNMAILGTEGGDKLKILEEIRPDIIALGSFKAFNQAESFYCVSRDPDKSEHRGLLGIRRGRMRMFNRPTSVRNYKRLLRF